MAMQSVTAETLPARKYTGNAIGIDAQSASENILYALNGAEAISDIIQDNINGEGKDHWSDGAMWHLTQGQQALFAFARQQADLLKHELWYTHALLGDHGPEAKAKAERTLAQNADARRAA